MPDSGFLFMSFVSLFVGVSLFLAPKALARASSALDRTLGVLDEQLIRNRYVFGLLAFAASYAFFKIALALPTLRG